MAIKPVSDFQAPKREGLDPYIKGWFDKIQQSLRLFSNVGWRDLIGNIIAKTSGANTPTYAVYRNGIRLYQFSNAAMNEVWNEYNINHDYALGTDVYLSIHWTQSTVDTGGTGGTPGYVKWSFEVTMAKGHQQQAFPATKTFHVVQQASTTQYMHHVAEVKISTPGGSPTLFDSNAIEPDTVILVRLYRDPADASDTLNQTPFAIESNLHYQVNRYATPAKNPDFYRTV